MINGIYLDNAATTQIDPRVARLIADTYQQRLANPASQHQFGRHARLLLESSRESICSSLDCRAESVDADQLIFTSGGTEANNLAIAGLAENIPGMLLVSAIEHASVIDTANHLMQRGREVRFVLVDKSGVVDVATIEEYVTHHNVALVSVMTANNETGVIQPIERIAEICRNAKVLFHTDAVQSLGKQTLSFRKMNVDAMTITAHKIHGPVGIGALIVRSGVKIAPQVFGGSQQLGQRPGTESTALAVGLAKAVEIGVVKVDDIDNRVRTLRDRLQSALIDSRYPPAIIGQHSNRIGTILCLAYPGIDRQQMQLGLDRVGIACSTGSACASGSSQPSHVIRSMKLPVEIINGAIRFSLSRETREEDIDQAIQRIKETVDRMMQLR